MAKTPPQKSAPARKPGKGRPAGLFTWIAVGLVVVVVAALVIIKATSSSPAQQSSGGFTPVDATTLADLTQIPASVFSAVGVSSPVVPVTAPQAISGQKVLTETVGGKTLPEVYYLGSEYCPFCAAQRWSTIVALSRFGTFSNLGETSSSAVDSYPNTPTFTFVDAKFSSPYVAFSSTEQYNNVYNATTQFYAPLQNPTKAEAALEKKYDNTNFIKGITSSEDNSIPFLTFGDQYLTSGASYSPAALSGLTRTQIASALSNASNPVTEAIISSANYQTAVICTLTQQQPSNVCTSSGVKAADKVLKIS